MKGRTVNAHTFMTRTANHSTKGSRRGFVDVETGVDPASLLTPEQQRDSLKRRHAALGAQREELKRDRTPSGKVEWQRLGQQMKEIQDEITAINKAMDPTRNFTTFDAWFNRCAKTMLLPGEYERIAEAARRRMTEGAAP